MKCHNCEKNALLGMGPDGKILLCLDCYTKLASALTVQNEALERQSERIEAEMWTMVGLQPPSHLNKPRPQIYTGPITMQNISVKNSNIGILNAGNMNIIDSCVSTLANTGHQDFASAISTLTEAIVNDKNLTTEKKNEAVELTGALATEAIYSKDAQRPSLVHSIVHSLGALITTSASLITIWDKVKPVIELFFR